jgi:hypothetical protein
MRKFGDGHGILGEWVYNIPIFETCPYTWENEILHCTWSLEISIFFKKILKIEYTRTFISTVGIFVS